ncbi:MAG: hypothetical protein EA370_01410 [Wenzhouxiangella sp.]|nr:MAG: hypothetical protein EA370_01410 [Wenzhouxiangella sp.]
MLSGIRVIAMLGVLSGGCAPASADQPGSVFLIGHSLVNHHMPTMLEALAQDAGLSYSGGRQIINGANLQWQWNNSHTAEGMDARLALPSGDWDVLVMTEAVPLANHLTWSDTFTFAANFHDLALSANAQTRTYVYETWHCINSGLPAGCEWDDNDDIPWRDRLDQDLSQWQGIADHLNAEFSGPEVSLVPAGQAMALLYDRALAGEVPGIGHAFDLFSDDIHLTDAGNYFVALVMFATIFQLSPEGLTHQIGNQWGTPYDLPSAATVHALQILAWEAVQEYFGLADTIFASRFE